MLTDIIPAAWRARAYVAFLAVSGLLGATAVAFKTLNVDQPAWLTVALSVLAFVSAFVGALAKANVNPDPVPQRAVIGEPAATPPAPTATANADGTITTTGLDPAAPSK